ncbi:PREDICTED: LOW QUALITY PROTEIN: putative defensin-like protein 60 [Camelina sativa]|uniref:LOW QUALITY PROTEIN: putative defensin-like protein 60 n=1 Tax=Camelina sativa TaxID=90675 RepID=A0ABM1RLP4_CAMSA|nr:PREDICTED: LOW QUALITY PROTEIN: putative defensin-like protein 60 [Camelina sativa]
MNITKTSVIFFSLVILTNSLSNSDVLASPVMETSKNDVCFIPCTTRYGEYECWFDCTHKRYHDGGCVNGRCCCKK